MSPFASVTCYKNEQLQQEATEQTTSITVKDEKELCFG